jgi:hypothetical protein
MPIVAGRQRTSPLWVYAAALALILSLTLVFYVAKTRQAPTVPESPPLLDSK